MKEVQLCSQPIICIMQDRSFTSRNLNFHNRKFVNFVPSTLKSIFMEKWNCGVYKLLRWSTPIFVEDKISYKVHKVINNIHEFVEEEISCRVHKVISNIHEGLDMYLYSSYKFLNFLIFYIIRRLVLIVNNRKF